MPTSRKIFVLAAVGLGCHFAALAFHSALASGVIEFVLIVLAAAACFEAAGRASGFARRFWRLMGIAFALYAAGQVIATYYDSVLHASLTEWWPSDVLFLYHVAPMAMALFLGDDTTFSLAAWEVAAQGPYMGLCTLSLNSRSSRRIALAGTTRPNLPRRIAPIRHHLFRQPQRFLQPCLISFR